MWKTLFAVVESLSNPIIVPLTATPPYDVIQAEWQRYQELCGPIDVEISIPEKIKGSPLARKAAQAILQERDKLKK
jgi:hypothetical protein